jgi:6-pyruvoyltetrahydropterin/6-carboxytetrahydropterin synthase
MVTDFKHMGWLKNFLDDNLDHKFIIDKSDPLYDRIVGSSTKLQGVYIPGTDQLAGWEVDVNAHTFGSAPVYEMMEGFFIVDFVPTSENFCKWLFDVTSTKMAQLGIKVSRVDWFETPKSRSSYQA